MAMRIYALISLLLAVLLLLLSPFVNFAQTPGVQFKLIYQNGGYVVSMIPNATPSAPNLTLTAQVTIKVPHGTGATAFAIANLQALVPDTSWTVSTRINAPSEAPGFDYISFAVSFPTGNNGAFPWAANIELPVFSFQNTGTCPGPISLIENTDPFMPPNSAGTNPGNQIDILGLGSGNVYSGNTGIGLADCATATPISTPTATATNPTATPTGTATASNTPGNTPTTTPTGTGTPIPDLAINLDQPTPALAVIVQSSLPVTVRNQGNGAASGPLQTTLTLPTGLTAPATFASNGWDCTVINSTVTCTNPGPLAPQTSLLFNVPITPGASLAGKLTGPFNGHVQPAPGELNLSNNNAPSLTPPNPVVADSDGDGIPNLVEGTGDFDQDGIPNYLDLDADNDGIPDSVEGSADRDGDDKPNYLDLDADNDGIPDNVEAQSTRGFITASGRDDNQNGIDDAFELLGAPVDTDRDNTPDYLDTDADNDGVLDQFEARRGSPTGTDTDGDGIDNGFDHINGFAVADGITNPAADLPDTDSDVLLGGNVDYRDIDDDGDGVYTTYEVPDPNKDGNPADAQDTDSDGKPDYLDADDDGDGILTKNENADPNGDGNPADALDTDGDGIPDYLDNNPKPVSVASFTASWTADGVLVRWETSAELSVIGFRLYRSVTSDRSAATLVTAMIASQGQTGGVYTFADRYVTPGQGYTYWLAEVMVTGATRDVASDIARTQDNSLFLPLLRRP